MVRPFEKPHGRLPRRPSVPSPSRNHHDRLILPLVLSSSKDSLRSRRSNRLMRQNQAGGQNEIVYLNSIPLVLRISSSVSTPSHRPGIPPGIAATSMASRTSLGLAPNVRARSL